MRRRLMAGLSGAVAALVIAGPALACGGLLAPNGSVQLLRTSTLAAYKDGVEHYVTSFEFAGAAANFGSIIPLPGVPSNVRKGGDWTLQRLQIEVQPPVAEFALADDSEGAALARAEVLMEKRIDSLNVTILKGGAAAVGEWAKANGFTLPPDAPEVLDFYARRSPIFLAARFDAKDAAGRGFQTGDGVPVHVSIPTLNPWVPLRILGLGKQAEEIIEADVFLLTDGAPVMLPKPRKAGPGMVLERLELASESLLRDLRSDRGMKWLPLSGMWLTHLTIDAPAGELTHDLAIDSTGLGVPSPVAAGLTEPVDFELPSATQTNVLAWALAIAVAGFVLVMTGKLAGSAR